MCVCMYVATYYSTEINTYYAYVFHYSLNIQNMLCECFKLHNFSRGKTFVN